MLKFCWSLVFYLAFHCAVCAQFVAKLEMKEEVEGICNHDEVYALFGSLEGQADPVSPKSKDEILVLLNEQVEFIKTHPKFKGKGMIGLLINCHGELVQVKMSNSTGNDALDAQIEAVFATLTHWTPGTLYGTKVDASELYSFKVKKGRIVWG